MPVIQEHVVTISNGSFTIVCNTAENTKFVYFNFPIDAFKSDDLCRAVVESIERSPGKYYLVLSENSDLASYIRKTKPRQLIKLTGPNSANPLWVQLSEQEHFDTLATVYQLQLCHHIVSEEDSKRLSADISAFQIQALCDIRVDLSDDVAKQKIETRYQPAAIEAKLQSDCIAIFTARQDSHIIATLVITKFPTVTSGQSKRYLYASDLILRKDLISNQRFVSQFLGSVYKSIQTIFPDAEILTLLAPGPALGKCITETTRTDGHFLHQVLDVATQDHFGLLTYFVESIPQAVLLSAVGFQQSHQVPANLAGTDESIRGSSLDLTHLSLS